MFHVVQENKHPCFTLDYPVLALFCGHLQWHAVLSKQRETLEPSSFLKNLIVITYVIRSTILIYTSLFLLRFSRETVSLVLIKGVPPVIKSCLSLVHFVGHIHYCSPPCLVRQTRTKFHPGHHYLVWQVPACDVTKVPHSCLFRNERCGDCRTKLKHTPGRYMLDIV